MRCVVTSDAHPDKSTGGFQRYDDVEAAWMKAATHASGIDNGEAADLFIFAGDLCEPDSPDYIRCVTLAMKVAHACGTRSLWIPGNHDVLDDGRNTTSLDPLGSMFDLDQYIDEPPVMLVKEPRVVAVDGKLVACFPYTSRTHDYDPLEVLAYMVGRHGRDVSLVVSHLMLDGIGPGSDKLQAGSESEMMRGRDVFLPVAEIARQWPSAKIINGHYHSRQRWYPDKATLPNVYVDIPGSLANLTRDSRFSKPAFLEVRI